MAFFYNATVMGRKWAVTPYWIWNVVLFALFAAGIVAVTMRHFRRFHMRDRG
jgi:hypothetical protein